MQIIKALGTIPATENIEILFYQRGAMIGSWWWVIALCIWTYPLKCNSVKLMKIIQVVFSITSPEDVYFIVIAVSSVHIAGSRWNALCVEI